jgi:hypothetical protein
MTPPRGPPMLHPKLEACVRGNEALDRISCLVLVFLAALLAGGCSAARSLGKNVVGGALDELDQRGGTGPLGAHLVGAARDELTGEESRAKLKATQHDLLDGLTADVGALRTQLVGAPLRADADALRDELLGRARRDLLQFRDDLLGQATEIRTRRLVEAALGADARGHLALMRDDLLGTATQAYVRDLVRTAASTAVEEYRQKLQPSLDEQKTDLEMRATRIIWTLGAALAAVVAVAAFLFRRQRKAQAMLDVVTTQIHQMPQRAAYDELTRRISNRAKEAGVEKQLRQRLDDQSLLGDGSWRPPDAEPPPPAAPR